MVFVTPQAHEKAVLVPEAGKGHAFYGVVSTGYFTESLEPLKLHYLHFIGEVTKT